MRIFLRGYAFDPRLRRFSLCAFVIYFSPYTYSHVLVRAWRFGRETMGLAAVARLAQAILVVAQRARTPAHSCLHRCTC